MGSYKWVKWGDKSRVTIGITHIRGLMTLIIATHEPPSKHRPRQPTSPPALYVSRNRLWSSLQHRLHYPSLFTPMVSQNPTSSYVSGSPLFGAPAKTDERGGGGGTSSSRTSSFSI